MILNNLDTVNLSVTVDSFRYCSIRLSELKMLKELRLAVRGEEERLSTFTMRHMGFNLGDGFKSMVLESKKGFLFAGCADFSTAYPSLKRLEIRGDIAFGSSSEDAVVFVPRGCEVICDNAEFMKHVRER